MTNQHPITPPPELVEEWIKDANHNAPVFAQVAVMGAQWGADQELEACCEWLVRNYSYPEAGNPLRAARRPKPPSLKEQALGALNLMLMFVPPGNQLEQGDTIRRALEALPNE